MSWVGGCLFWSLAAVVADDLVDLYDDVLGVLDGTDGCRSVCLQTSEGWRFSGSYRMSKGLICLLPTIVNSVNLS